jgi:hypothetical protein
MKKLLTYFIGGSFILLVVGTMSGCAEQIIAIPGTIVDGTIGVVKSVWHLATDWIPGVGNPASVE